MGTGIPITPFDGAVLAVLLVAVARGLYIGLIREGFSIAALGAAVLATRYGTAPAADWLQRTTGGEIGPAAAPWLMGAAIAIGTVGLFSLAAKLMRRGARFAGLDWADRLGGAALGAAEGALVSMLIVLASTWLIGRDHPVVASSRSLEAYDVVRSFVDDHADELPSVAAPGRWRQKSATRTPSPDPR